MNTFKKYLCDNVKIFKNGEYDVNKWVVINLITEGLDEKDRLIGICLTKSETPDVTGIYLIEDRDIVKNNIHTLLTPDYYKALAKSEEEVREIIIENIKGRYSPVIAIDFINKRLDPFMQKREFEWLNIYKPLSINSVYRRIYLNNIPNYPFLLKNLDDLNIKFENIAGCKREDRASMLNFFNIKTSRTTPLALGVGKATAALWKKMLSFEIPSTSIEVSVQD